MGKVFLEHLGGRRIFSCATCNVDITNRDNLVSSRFRSTNGRAYLFNKGVNINYGETLDRAMVTGRYIVRDVTCKQCFIKLGWFYKFSFTENQQYKEGKIVLEKAMIVERDGIDEAHN